MSDLCTGGTALGTFTWAGGGGNAALYDDNVETFGADPNGHAVTTWTGYDFGVNNAVRIGKIHITNRAAESCTPPDREWSLEWSDNGTDWYVVGTFTFQAEDGEETTATFFNSGKHRYWRIKNTSGIASGSLHIAEVEMMVGKLTDTIFPANKINTHYNF